MTALRARKTVAQMCDKDDSENIDYRVSVYIEEYALSSGLLAGDAIIAATAVENSMVLATGNRKHFKPIKDLSLKIFRP